MKARDYSIIYFIISSEYLLFFAFLLVKSYRHILKTKPTSNKFLYFMLIELYCILRFVFEVSYAFQLQKFAIGFIFSLTYLISYSALSIISISWTKISIKNSFDSTLIEKSNRYSHYRALILVGNLTIWLIFLVLATLYACGYIQDNTSDYIPWVFRVYEGFVTVLILILLLISGVKLLYIIYKFSHTKPKRLIILILIALTSFIIKTIGIILILISPTMFGVIKDNPQA
jgi:hypothetical protein